MYLAERRVSSTSQILLLSTPVQTQSYSFGEEIRGLLQAGSRVESGADTICAVGKTN